MSSSDDPFSLDEGDSDYGGGKATKNAKSPKKATPAARKTPPATKKASAGRKRKQKSSDSDDSDAEFGDGGDSPPVQRRASARPTKRVRVISDDDEGEGEDDASVVEVKAPPKAKRAPTRPAARKRKLSSSEEEEKEEEVAESESSASEPEDSGSDYLDADSDDDFGGAKTKRKSPKKAPASAKKGAVRATPTAAKAKAASASPRKSAAKESEPAKGSDSVTARGGAVSARELFGLDSDSEDEAVPMSGELASPSEPPASQSQTTASQALASQEGKKKTKGPVGVGWGRTARTHATLASTIPIVVPHARRNTTFAMETNEPELDLSGDTGAVGRFSLADDAESPIVLDLKGFLFRGNLRPCASLLVVNIGPQAAKVEAVVDRYVHCTHASNVLDTETLVEGQLEEDLDEVSAAVTDVWRMDDDEGGASSAPTKGRGKKGAGAFLSSEDVVRKHSDGAAKPKKAKAKAKSARGSAKGAGKGAKATKAKTGAQKASRKSVGDAPKRAKKTAAKRPRVDSD